ncbi:MAG: MFS transporter [Asgard group archaeon]|nr:MFS transporter [Asgard group archaeon]
MESTIRTTNSKENNGTIDIEAKKRFRDYLYFFSGQQISILGSSIVSFVLIWWVSETTNSELMLGLASFCSLGPFLLVAPFSGVIADRAKRKPLLITVDSLQSFFTVILTIIFMIYFIPNQDDPTDIANKTLLISCVFVTLALRGVMQAFHTPAVSAMIPSMVPQKHLSRINGISYLISGIINVIGPALGAILMNVLNISLIMWLDGITFLIAVIPLVLIKIPSPQKIAKGQEISFFRDFKDGIDTIRDIRGLFALMIGSTLINFFLTPVGTLLPLFVSKVHLGTKENYALVIGLLQAGMIAGGLFMTIFKGFKKKTRVLAFCVAITFTFEMLLITIPSTLGARFWVIGILLFFALLPAPIANTSLSTVFQTIIPKEKFGRVFSVIIILAQAITPIGTFLSGLIGEYVSIGIVYTVSGALGLISFLLIYLMTPARKLDFVVEQKIAIIEEAEKEKMEQKTIESIDDSIELTEIKELNLVDRPKELPHSK